jgi:hypothetical protein
MKKYICRSNSFFERSSLYNLKAENAVAAYPCIGSTLPFSSPYSHTFCSFIVSHVFNALTLGHYHFGATDIRIAALPASKTIRNESQPPRFPPVTITNFPHF